MSTIGSYSPSAAIATPTDLTDVEAKLASLITAVQANDSDDDGTALATIKADIDELDLANRQGVLTLLGQLTTLTSQNQAEDAATQAAIAALSTPLAAIVADLADEEPRSITVKFGHARLAAGATWNPPAGNLQAISWTPLDSAGTADVTADGNTVSYPAASWGASVERDSDLKVDLITAIVAIGTDVIIQWTIEA